MTPKVWGYLLWGSLALMLGLAIVANVASGGSYIYRDTFKYDDAGDGTAEEIHGATVTAYPLDSKTAYASTTTDTTLSGYNFALTLSDTQSYYWVEVTNYSSSHYMEQTRFQVNTRNFTIPSGDTLTINGAIAGTYVLTTGLPVVATRGIAADSLTLAKVATLPKIRVSDSLAVARVRSTSTVSARGLTVDTLNVALHTRIAGLRTAPPIMPAASIPKGGVFSFRFDDCETRNFIVADTLEARGMRGTFAINTYTTSGVTTAANYLDTARTELVGMGHEVADHSPRHWFGRGVSVATLAASLDSSRVRMDSLFGSYPRLWIQPGAPAGEAWVAAVYSDTSKLALQSRGYDYGMFWNYGWQAPRATYDAGTWLKRRNKYNLTWGDLTGWPLASAESLIARSLAGNKWQTALIHMTNDYNLTLACELAAWLDSARVPVMTISDAADLFYNGHADMSGNAFSDPQLLIDRNTDNWPEACYQTAGNSAVWLQGYPTPIGTVGAILMPDAAEGEELHFVGCGAQPKEKYAASIWVKNINRDGAYPDSILISLGCDGAVGGYWFAISDSLWHRYDYQTGLPLNFLVTANDSCECPEIVVQGSHASALALGDTMVVAAPSIVRLDETLPSGILDNRMFPSADGDTLYILKPTGAWGYTVIH